MPYVYSLIHPEAGSEVKETETRKCNQTKSSKSSAIKKNRKLIDTIFNMQKITNHKERIMIKSNDFLKLFGTYSVGKPLSWPFSFNPRLRKSHTVMRFRERYIGCKKL